MAAYIVTYVEREYGTTLHELAGQVLSLASHDHRMPGLPSWVPDWSSLPASPCQGGWTRNPWLPVGSWTSGPMESHQFFRVHRTSGSLCILAVEIDTMGRFLRHGFHETWKGGIFSARAGDMQISVSRGLHNGCRATDGGFSLSRYKFALILRRVISESQVKP